MMFSIIDLNFLVQIWMKSLRRPAVQNVDWQKWFYGSGLPELPTMNCVLAEKVQEFSPRSEWEWHDIQSKILGRQSDVGGSWLYFIAIHCHLAADTCKRCRDRGSFRLLGLFHSVSQVELLFSSLKGGYEGSKEDIEGWFPKQTMPLGEMETGGRIATPGIQALMIL